MCSLSRTTDLIHRTDRRAKILTKEKIQAGIAQINSCYIWEKAGGIQNPLVYSMRTLSSSSSNWVRATWKRKSNTKFSLVQSLSRVQLLDPMDCSTLGLPVHLQLTEITQTLLHWVSDAIQTSYPLSPPSPDALNLSQHQGPFQWVRFSHQVASVLSFSFNINPFNDDSGLISFQSGDSQESSPTPQFKGINSLALDFIVQFSHSHMTTGKNIALTRWTFMDKVMSLLFNMLSRLVISFLPRMKCLLILWLQSPPAVILEPKKLSLSLFPLFPHLFAMKWWDQMPWS